MLEKLPKKIAHVAQALCDALKKYDDFEGIYLYGSRIRGDAKEDSDLDVIILFNQDPPYAKQLDISGIVIDLEYRSNIFIDHHPMTISNLKKNPFFYEEVVGKGIYYARG